MCRMRSYVRNSRTLEALANEQGQIYQQLISRSFYFEIPEKYVGPERIQRLVNNIATVMCLQLGSTVIQWQCRQTAHRYAVCGIQLRMVHHRKCCNLRLRAPCTQSSPAPTACQKLLDGDSDALG